MNLEIRHRTGKSNINVDALSRNPVPDQITTEAQVLQLTSLEVPPQQSDTSSPEPIEDMSKLQRKDPKLHHIITLIESGKLPDDEKLVKKLVLEQDQYEIIDGILNHESPTNPGHWRIVVPECLQLKVVEEAHSGRFAGHFAERRIYNTLKKAYWWKGMRSAVRKQVRSV